MTEGTYSYRPDYATPPGYVLEDHLESRGMTPAEFARQHALSTDFIERILDGSAPIDAETAALFGREFGLEASVWLNMEAIYRRRLGRVAASVKESQLNGTEATIPSKVKQIVCLANSRKRGGRCVAGKEMLADGRFGGWLRPVSSREDEEVSERERCYADGEDPQLLDVIAVPILNPRPKTYQRENWLLDPSRRWSRVGQLQWADLPGLTDQDQPLWINGYSSRGGQNDQVPVAETADIDNSLRLIQVDYLTVIVSEPARPSANYPILRGRFSYHGDEYCFRITDPESESGSVDLPYGEYRVGDRYLTVSLGEPFEGNAYKLIAAIIKP